MTSHCAWKIIVCLGFMSSGCAMWDGGRNWLTGQRTDQSEPEVREDKWGYVGKEARGNMPREEADWFERYLWSEKARDINRSVGFD